MRTFVAIAVAATAAVMTAAPSYAAGWEIRGLLNSTSTADCISRAYRILNNYSRVYSVGELQRGSIGVYAYQTDHPERDVTIQCTAVDTGGQALLIVHDTRNDTDIAATAERIVQYWDANAGK
ncbi:MAG: hypothetical protein GC208_03670 [Alphaproteobacteria bacterium]|nr:hypothetical protein [Alphaproteobacteria bacterium]